MRDEHESTFRHWLSPSLGITIGIEEVGTRRLSSSTIWVDLLAAGTVRYIS